MRLNFTIVLWALSTLIIKAQQKEFTNSQLLEKLTFQIDSNKNYSNSLYYLEILIEDAPNKTYSKLNYLYLAGLYYQNLGLFKESKEYLSEGIEEIKDSKKISGIKPRVALLNQELYEKKYKVNQISKTTDITQKTSKDSPRTDSTSKISASGLKKENQSSETTINTPGQLVDETINTVKEEFGKLIKFLSSDEPSSKSDSLKNNSSNKQPTREAFSKQEKKAKNDLTGDDMYSDKKKLSNSEIIRFTEREVSNLHAAFLALLGKAYSLENELSLADQSFANASKLISADSIYDERDAITLLYIMENDINFQQYKSFENNKSKLPISEAFCLRDSIKLTQFTAQYTKVLGDYYFAIQDQKRALKIYKKAIERYESLFGFHIDLPSLYVRVAEMETNSGETNSALSNLEYCRKLVARKIGKLNPEYAKLISTYASIKDKLPNLSLTEIRNNGQLHSSAVNTLNRLLGNENINSALAYIKLVNHNNLFPSDSTLKSNESELLKSIELIEKTYQPTNIESINAFSILTRYYFNKKYFPDANKYLNLVTEKISRKIVSQVGLLNENELNNIIAFLKTEMRSLRSLALTQSDQFPQLHQQIIESNILLKGLLLSSSQMLKVKNSEIQNNQAALFKVKNEISKAYSLSFSGMSLRIDSLEIKLKELEKEILNAQPELAKQQAGFEIKSDQFEKVLKPGEIILDFVLLPENGGLKYSYYVSLIELGQKPKLSKICDAANLHEYLQSCIQKNDSLTFLKMYGQPALNLKTKGSKIENNKLYDLIFKPIATSISNKTKIIISPDGELNTIAFPAISLNGNYLINKYEFVQLLNPKTILNAIEVKIEKNDDLTLMGGVNYEKSQIIGLGRGMKSQNMAKKEIAKVKYYPSFSWDLLNGTKTEINKINSILKDSKISLISDKNASEEYFKTLNNNSPKFLHIASHGFSMARDTLSLLPFFYSENPMMRSGLVMAGANNFWTTGKVEDEKEDGILTAYEVSGMDLSNVKLATLSACQTALGSIGSDGVYGLQRAFKIAGTQQLLVSLWEVSDYGTQLLMSEFYTNLQLGKNTRDAFRLAQIKLKNNPKASPFWWSAFVLVE